ncbi:hypothetical protein RIF29_22189 [Crotalaria pallida]|uniref:Uncharacterized protein n=1 Tax=Crotalaria pallida TaxID=3830 RepID=A0AAN9FCX8_CROPI
MSRRSRVRAPPGPFYLFFPNLQLIPIILTIFSLIFLFPFKSPINLQLNPSKIQDYTHLLLINRTEKIMTNNH